ncbi:MAG: BamA/TamA family outer membrane protein, partial [Elusimicrobia bacterium]|nr:BamA/TamA family outer membrane protein [Elusimicrobiota bacterium]
ARVSPDKSYNEETKQMDVNFDVIEGPVIYVDHIDVEGNKATKTHVIRREIVQKEGVPFQASRIRKSQEKIMNLGFIDDVQLDFTSPTDPDKVDLAFEVAEGKPGILTAGAGFSSLDDLIGTLSLQHMNLFGRAQRASVQWQFGSRVQDYSLSWTTPWTFGKPTSLGVDLFNTRRLRPFQSESAGYVDKRLGGSMRLGPRFSEDKYQLNFTYTFQKISISNVDSQFLTQLPESTSIHSSFGAEAAIDTRDSIWDPTRGQRHSIGFTMAGGPIFQGDIHFFSPSINNSAHFHLWSVNDYPFVLTFANRAAYVTQFGETKEVPVFNRFFLGGQDTLRGYSISGEVGRPDGGKVYDVFNVEFGFPLARERKKTIVKFVTFYDAGTTWDNMRSVHMRIGSGERDIRQDVGFGIRFVTPAFPIRLDWGYGLNHRPGERLYQINFGIGNLF